mmetsp:Transcript_39704/g.95032  ORF Transcript_39704/g.95032 Transcript_39704/m.95032 type:complete len:80 (+) Transcript_39704:555-794(+)
MRRLLPGGRQTSGGENLTLQWLQPRLRQLQAETSLLKKPQFLPMLGHARSAPAAQAAWAGWRALPRRLRHLAQALPILK